MKAAELRNKNIEELKKEHVELLREQFNLRMQKGSGQLSKPQDLSVVRKNIARVLTVLREKQGQVNE